MIFYTNNPKAGLAVLFARKLFRFVFTLEIPVLKFSRRLKKAKQCSRQNLRRKGKFISEHIVFHRQHIDMINIFLHKYNTFTFMITYVQIQFKGPSREIGGLLSDRLSNMSLELEVS